MHAKAYTADQSLALVGSANLSAGGFQSNLELMVRFDGEEALPVISFLEAQVAPRIRYIPVAHVIEWVTSNLELIKEARRNLTGQPEQLAPVQESLDRLLQRDLERIPEPEQRVIELHQNIKNDFINWLQANPNLCGTTVLFNRATNKDGQNLTGHFSQSFFASFRFLQAYPEQSYPLVEQLEKLEGNALIDLTENNLSEVWVNYLDAHALDVGDGYRYSILRGILPPSLGGTLMGGGGGSSTLKRMLPLVAKFMLDNGEIR